MSAGRVYLIGGGPGAPDLLTVRGARAISRADVVIWGRTFLMEEAVTEHARPDAELVPWPPATMADILRVYDRARDENLVVARVHSGDPAIFGKLEELDEVRARGVPHEIVPGVTAASAAAAALGRELTTSDAPRALIFAAPGREEEEQQTGPTISELARPGATMAVFMSATRPDELQRELLEGGYGPDTPCAVVHQVSWPQEVVVRCPLHGLAERLEGLDLMTLVLVGPALDGPTP